MSRNLKQTLPTDLITHVTAMCGDRGAAWLADLPDAISKLERDWSVVVGDPFSGIEYNFVAPAVADDGSHVVIKIAPPFETTEIHGEAKFLRTLQGEGAVRLIAEDREAKAILIERAVPGKSLVDLFADDPIGSIPPALEVLKSITTDPPDNMSDVPTLDGWFSNFRKRVSGSGFPDVVADRAIAMYSELSRNENHRKYIHGDFHLGNIVDSDRTPFLAIDPKGIVGHVGYDAAVFLLNLHRWQRETNERVDVLIDDAVRLFADGLGLSRTEIRQWAFAHTIISSWWNFDEMPGVYDSELAVADIWNV
jgi:streptomycin 6-kinase